MMIGKITTASLQIDAGRVRTGPSECDRGGHGKVVGICAFVHHQCSAHDTF